MISYKQLEKEFLGTSCRSCMNARLHLRLKPRDCEYLYYPYPCRFCSKRSNIVVGVRALSRWKLLFASKRGSR